MVEYSFPKADGDVWFASEANTNWYIAQSAFSNTMQGINSGTAYVRTVNNAFASSSGLTLSSTVYDGVGNTIRLLPDVDGTPTESAVFTGGSMDADWDLTTGGAGASCTFNAANDRVDMSFGLNLQGAAYTTFNGSTSTNGIFEVNIQNISWGDGNNSSISIVAMGITITISYTGTIGDSTSGASTTTLVTKQYFRIMKSGGWARTQYSDDDITWTTLNTVTDQADSAGYPQVSLIKSSGGGTGSSCTVHQLDIFDDIYVSSGTMTTGSTATGTTTRQGYVTYGATTAGGSSIQAALSADAGGNFNNASANTAIQITNTGTNFQTRFTLTAGASDTPILSWFSSTYMF